MSAKIETVEQQYKHIISTETKREYKKFYNSHFSGGTWIIYLNQDMGVLERKGKLPLSDYFYFLTLVGYSGSRYGYPSLDGQVAEYQRKDHQKLMSSPRIQLARLSNTCYLELRAAKVKQEVIAGFKEIKANKKMQDAVWGIFFKSSHGEINVPFYTDEQFLELASKRLAEPRPICLPDLDLSRKIASMHFTMDDAERMPQSEFESEIIPTLKRHIGFLLDVERIEW